MKSLNTQKLEERATRQREESERQNILNSTLKDLQREIESLDSESEEIKRVETELQKISTTLQDLATANQSGLDIHVGGSLTAQGVSFNKDRTTVYVKDSASLSMISFEDAATSSERRARNKEIELESSLPSEAALQPGSTAVYTAVLNVTRSLVFSPSKFRMQFNVIYTFQARQTQLEGSTLETLGQPEVHANTVSTDISIRPSVYSVMTGASFGGFFGAVGRILQVTNPESWSKFVASDLLGLSTTVLVSVILSAIAIVFLVRKSDAQSFVSIEDFWGGLLVGFLVGYTGTSFFEELTGVAPE